MTRRETAGLACRLMAFFLFTCAKNSRWLAGCVVAALLWMAQAQSEERSLAATPVADPLRGKTPGEVRDDNVLKMKLVWCPPGFVTMEQAELVNEQYTVKVVTPNDDDGEPTVTYRKKWRTQEKINPVKVFVTKGYWLGKYEVTQFEWKAVIQTESVGPL